ncbi:hypothetical protein FHG87_008442 [Trinorchestia longiramus]|nr:hypothetical protein FHG87_008442 [Trinorchestia longiramus]
MNFDKSEAFFSQQNPRSHLASIFDDPPAPEKASGRSPLHYVPPKQPKSNSEVVCTASSRSSTPGTQHTADINPVLLAVKVDLSLEKDVNNEVEQVGIAVSCILAPKQKFSSSAWLLYQNPKHPLAKFLIDNSLSLSVISNECLQVHALNSSTKWLLKTTPEQLVALLLQIYACKAVAGSSRITTELLCPAHASTISSSALQPLDWTEVCLHTWEISSIGRVKQRAEGERMRVCVALPQQGGSPEWTAHLVGAKKTERRLVICKDGDELKGYDVTIEKVKRRKPRSSSSTPAPSEGGTATPHAGGTATPHTGGTANGDDAASHASSGTATCEQDAGTTRACVLSRIVRMGQPVFGVPATVTAALEQAAVTPCPPVGSMACSAASDDKRAEAPHPTASVAFAQVGDLGNVNAEACDIPGSVAGSFEPGVTNPAARVDVTASNDSYVVSSDHRSPNSFQPISLNSSITERVGSENVQNYSNMNSPASTLLTAAQDNSTFQNTSMGSHPNTFHLIGQQAVESSTGLIQPVPYSSPAVRHALPSVYSLHPPVSGSISSNTSFHSPTAMLHNAAASNVQSTLYNTTHQPSTPHSSASPYFNSFNPAPHHLNATPRPQGPHLFHLTSPAAPAQTELPLSLLLSESRSQNTELRIAVARMADQVADVQHKMQEVLSTRNKPSEFELLDTLSTRVNSRISDIFSAQQQRDVTASENLAVARHQISLLRRALVAHCPELERAVGDTTPVSRVSSDVISWTEDLNRDTDFMDKVIELASGGKLVYCSNCPQDADTLDLTSLPVTSTESVSPVVLAEKYSRTLEEFDEVSRKYTGVCAELESAKMYEKKFYELQQMLSSSKQFAEDHRSSDGVHSAAKNDGTPAADEKSEPQELYIATEATDDKSLAGHHETDDSCIDEGKTIEAKISDEESVSVAVAESSNSSNEQQLSHLNAISGQLLKQLESFDLDALKSFISKSSEEAAPLNTLMAKLISVTAGCDGLTPLLSNATVSASELVEGSSSTCSLDEEVAAIKEENDNLRELLKEKEESVRNLEALMSQELRLKDEALEVLNVSKIGVEAELLELSAAQQSMEGDLRILRQQTINLRQMADKYKRKCLEPEFNPELPNGDIPNKQVSDSEGDKNYEEISFRGSSMPKKMDSISTQTDFSIIAPFEQNTTVPASTCDVITQTIPFESSFQTSSASVVMDCNGVCTPSTSSTIESIGASTQTIPTAVESTRAATQTSLTRTVQPSCDASTQTTLDLMVLLDRSSKLLYSAEDFEESISSSMKKAMNAVYKSTKEFFSLDQQYEGKDIRRLVQSVIRDTTLQYLEVFAQQQDERRRQALQEETQELQLSKEQGQMQPFERQEKEQNLHVQQQLGQLQLPHLSEDQLNANPPDHSPLSGDNIPTEKNLEHKETLNTDNCQSSLSEPIGKGKNSLEPIDRKGSANEKVQDTVVHSLLSNGNLTTEKNLENTVPLKTNDNCRPSLSEPVSEGEKLLEPIDNDGSANEKVEDIVLEYDRKSNDSYTQNEMKSESETCANKHVFNDEVKNNQDGNEDDSGFHLGQEEHNLTESSLQNSDASVMQVRSSVAGEKKKQNGLSSRGDEHCPGEVDANENDASSNDQKFGTNTNLDNVDNYESHGIQIQDNLLYQELNDNFHGNKKKVDNVLDISESNSNLQAQESSKQELQRSIDNLSTNEESNKKESEERNDEDHLNQESNDSFREDQSMNNSVLDQKQTSQLDQPHDIEVSHHGGVFSSTPAPDASSARAQEIRSYSSQPPPISLFSSDEEDDWFT